MAFFRLLDRTEESPSLLASLASYAISNGNKFTTSEPQS